MQDTKRIPDWEPHNLLQFVEEHCLDEFTTEEIIKMNGCGWYNRGIEPQESLYYFLYNVAKVFGRELTQSEYDAKENTMFTADVYVLGNWTIELIVGQGSAILIDKIK